MDILRNGSTPHNPGLNQWFSGSITLEAATPAYAHGRPGVAVIHFEPGARTHWHTHPLGQTLIITQGQGRAQSAGGPVVVLNPGDVVWFAPAERHWHGAAPDTAMTHIAVQAAENGSTVDWEGPVSDTDYSAAP